jgi:hypothetical protein
MIDVCAACMLIVCVQLVVAYVLVGCRPETRIELLILHWVVWSLVT